MLLMLTAIQAVAQDVTFTAQAPQAVVVGNQFRITYKINTGDQKEFRAPDMKSLSVLSGPNMSSSQSVVITNGSRTQSTTITFTYIVVATEEGDLELDGATVTAAGKHQSLQLGQVLHAVGLHAPS